MALFASITWADGSNAYWPYGLLSLRCKIDTFFHDFLISAYIDSLRQYLVVPNPNIWPGPYAGTTGLSVSAQVSKNGTVTDGEVAAALQSEIHDGILAYTTSPIFYCVLVPPNVVVIDANGVRSDDPNHAFGGYHGVFQGANVGPINYCVIVGVGDIDELTYRLSHETVEQITNSDWAGWYGNADSLVNELIGFPANATPEICDYTAIPQQIVQAHGWKVAPFAYEVDRTDQGFAMKTAPLSDQVPASNPDHGRIHLDTKLTRTSCLGGIIEFQQAYFEATASHYGQDQIIGTLSWSASSDPPGIPVVEVNGNASRTYVLVIPYGCKSVTVRCTVQTAFLGCVVSMEEAFRVITQAQADQDDNICALVKRIKEEERYFDPLWWIKRFDPEFNPKAIEVDEAITRIAKEEGVSHPVLAEAKRLLFKDLTSRIDAMIAAFRIDRRG